MRTHTDLVTADDGIRRELVEGELHESAPWGRTHGRVAMRFSWPLGQYVEEHDLGEVYAAETGFLIGRDPDTVRAPDAAFVAKVHAAAVPEGKGFFPGAPDLVAEVISPGDTYADVEAKVDEWLSAGCRMAVVINPRDRTMKVYRSVREVAILTADDTFDGADVVPGFRFEVGRLFAQ